MNAVTSYLLHVLQRGPQPTDAIAAGLQDSLGEVPTRPWLATLQFQGLIREEAQGRWAITAAGLAQLRGGAP